MSDEQLTDEEVYGELARRLRIAYASYAAGLAYSTVERKYARPDEPAGKYWMELAKHIVGDVAKRMNEDGDVADLPESGGRGDN
jgi:hypothetical protein